MKYIAIISLLPFVVACASVDQPAEDQTPENTPTANQVILSEQQLRNSTLERVSLKKQKMSGTLQLSGKVDVRPDDLASLSSPLGGHIRAVNALPGMPVHKGDVLLVLEDQQFIQLQQDYLTAVAKLRSAEADYHRQRTLHESLSASGKAFQLAETEYQTLLAEKNGLEEKLRLIHIDPASLNPADIRRSIRITAPFNGFVSKVMVNKGRYVAPQDILLELINPDGLLLNLNVFENDWLNVSVGQRLEAYTNREPEKKVQAQIIATGNAINDDGSTGILAKVTDAGGVKLTPGLYIHAKVQLDEVEADVLPEDAVLSHGGKTYVFEWVQANTFRLLPVSTGTVQDGKIAVLNPQDLNGKDFVGKGAYALLMALKNTDEEG